MSEAKDYEDVTIYGLDDDQEQLLLEVAPECTFMWSTQAGWPVGVIMNFVWHEGKFWLTAADQRKRISAVRRDPRVSVCINGFGTKAGTRTVTYAGICTVRDDAEIKRWFYHALATKLFGDTPQSKGFEAFLDSPHRIVLEVVPERRIGFDGHKMMGATMEALTKIGNES